MLFKDIIGQEIVKKKIFQLLQQNRLPHAILLHGKEGVGTLPLSIAFAQLVLTYYTTNHITTAIQNPNDIALSPLYQRLSKWQYPDLYFSYPVVPKKSGQKVISADYIKEWIDFVSASPYGSLFDWISKLNDTNKQGNISEEECQDILHKMQMSSSEGGYKVLIMWLPEYLGKQGNTLLKLIEEPPADTLFLFATENRENILPTIVSRCFEIQLQPLTPKDIVVGLINQHHVSSIEAEQIAGISEDNYAKAIQLLSVDKHDWQKDVRTWLNITFKRELIQQVAWVNDMHALGKEKQKFFLRYFLHLVEQTIQFETFLDAGSVLPSNQDFVHRMSKIADLQQLISLSKMLSDGIYLIERNANAKMLFQAYTIQLYQIIKKQAPYQMIG